MIARRIHFRLPRFSCRVWKDLSALIGVFYGPPDNGLLEFDLPVFASRAESCDFAAMILSSNLRLNEMQMSLFWQAARLVDAELEEFSREMWLGICADARAVEVDARALELLVSDWHPQYFQETVNILWTVDYLIRMFSRATDSTAPGVDMVELTV
jgi:hypothetical protein